MKKQLLFLSVLMFGLQSMYCQSYGESENTVESESLTTESAQLNYVQENVGVVNQGSLVNIQQVGTPIGNTIFINQEGSFNNATAVVSSNNSAVVIDQDGNNNLAYLYLNATVVRQQVTQKGNNNFVLDYSPNGVASHTGEINQEGNGNNTLWFGGNSISEGLLVNQAGNNSTVIVRHF